MMAVQVRGVVYPSVRKAAARLRVKPQTVYSALSEGRVDRLGVGIGRHGNQVGPKALPVRVGARSFPSITALARVIGRDPKTVNRWLKRADGQEKALRLLLEREREIERAAERERKREMEREMKRGCDGRA